MISSTEALRTAIRNEGLPLSERKQAAEHLVTELVEAVPAPGEDDAEVIALHTPPSVDGPLGDIYTRAWAIANESRRWAASGPTPLQAVRYVQDQRRTELLKTIYQDKTRHGLEREAAAQRLLDAAPPLSLWRKNGYTAQKLVETSHHS